MTTFLLAVMVASAPLAQQPERDTFSPNKGSGRIRGSVTATDTGQPIRRATVRLSAAGGPTLTVHTDAGGRFEFVDLPAAKFTLTAMRAGFVQLPLTPRPLGVPERRFDLAPGQRLDIGDIRMARGGVVTGRVFDEFGDPIPEAYVQAFRVHYAEGIRRLLPVRGISTNDIGQFRIYGLPPGTYYVTGAIQSNPRDLFTHIDPSPSRPSESGGFAPTFYPGVVSGADARPIAVEAGQEVANLEFGLQAVRLARLSGRVVDSQGRAATGVAVSLTARNVGAVLGKLGLNATADGRFTFSALVPGEYRIDVRAKPAVEAVAVKGDLGVGTPPDAPEFASVPVTLIEDIEGLIVTMSRGHVVTGRVTIDGAPSEIPTLTNAHLVAHDTTAAGPSEARLAAVADIRPDGTFEIRSVGGTRIIRMEGLPVGWTLKMVRAGGIDVTDLGLDVRSDTSDVEVIVNSKPSSISGIVTDAQGRAVGDRTVIVFPEDRARRSGLMNRHVKSARASADGRFAIEPVPAGTYFAAVLDAVADDDWQAPENLERIQRAATKFIVMDGELKTLALVVT
jgi:hypothetical protein